MECDSQDFTLQLPIDKLTAQQSDEWNHFALVVAPASSSLYFNEKRLSATVNYKGAEIASKHTPTGTCELGSSLESGISMNHLMAIETTGSRLKFVHSKPTPLTPGLLFYQSFELAHKFSGPEYKQAAPSEIIAGV